jgi:ferredoxin-type protein NapH
VAFLAFPVTLNYFSPYMIIDGTVNGIINGSLIIFALMFVSSLFVGRLWCGWICPGAGMQEICEPINGRRINGPKVDWIKWAIWIPWVTLIIVMAVRVGGYSSINFFYRNENIISVDAPPQYITYYLVLVLFFSLAMLVGRRAGCHTICWMAPFMMTGRWVRNRGGWPSLRLQANAGACVDCLKCSTNCPMSLNVHTMVKREQMEHPECILCGTCVDNCSKGAIHFAFSRGSDASHLGGSPLGR